MAENTVTRALLSDSVYNKFGYSKAECSEILDVIIDEIIKGLEEEGEIKISSFGTFKVRTKKPRMGRNPKTKVAAPISARNVVSFYASNLLKNSINN